MSCRVPYFELKRDEAVAIAIIGGKVPRRPEEISTSTRHGDQRWSVLLACWNKDPQRRPACHSVRDMVGNLSYKIWMLDNLTRITSRCAICRKEQTLLLDPRGVSLGVLVSLVLGFL
jgi:hypothetical protein